MQQQTLARSFSLSGIGIHTGAAGRINVHPAEEGQGRKFLVGRVTIPAQAKYVISTARCTTLGKSGATVATVEHLLSALAGCGVDNALIEVSGPEIPILDGSALPFAQAIRDAGVVMQDKPAVVFTLSEPLTLTEGESEMTVTPAAEGLYTATTEFADWPEGLATVSYSVQDDYAAQVAPARTFAFQREVEMLIAAGLAKGGSLDNALIIAPPSVFSTPLRLPSEWCAHKLLDLIGDLALLDARLNARVEAIRPGHRINTKLALALREQRQRENAGRIA